MYPYRYLLAFLVAVCALTAHAQEDGVKGDALSSKIAAAQASGLPFRPVTLFTSAGGKKHTDLLEKETLLRPIAAQVSALYAARSKAVSLSLRTDEGQEYTLQLLQSQPLSANANMGVIDAAGRRRTTAADNGLHYQGSLAGDPHSIAAMSVFANGDVMILFANSEGNFVVGRVEDGSGAYIFYNDKAFRSRPEMPCGTKETVAKPHSGPAGKGATALECRKVQIYWECAYKVYQNKVTLTATRNYLTGLFNQIQALYANDHIAIELKTLYIWTVQDDYPTSGSSPALDKFKKFWNGLNNGFDGDLAHLITRDNSGNGGGNGGLAYLDVLCSKEYGYGYSDIYGVYQTIPTYSWDVEVISHETGHNLGSPHTHSCSWNTGTGGACGAIDNCYAVEAVTGCSTCSSTYMNSAPTTAWKGTIMSYCHLVARGISLANGFGPLPSALIRNNVSTNTCLASIINAQLTPTSICSGDGAVALSFAGDNFGTAPFTYAWSNGAGTQSLQGLTQPGTYTVAITDSNSCTASFSADVAAIPNPGNGIVPTVPMPICCRATAQVLQLKATAPAGITACSSVYWLKSGMPLPAVTDAKNYFDTTQPANVLPSLNAGSLNTGAVLSIQPPLSCAGPVSYYYTPVAVQLPLPADSFIANNSATQVYSNSGVQVGGYVLLPDQTSQVGACYLTDTPASQSLVVTITNYTGRASNMRLVVQQATDDTALYILFGAAGNGVYTIPASAIRGSLLQGLRITAMDYNCATTSGTFGCTSSQVSVAAARKVVYAGRALGMSGNCSAGASIKVDFAPTACTGLGVDAVAAVQASLYPNPATHCVTLRYTAATGGRLQMKVTDMVGKTIQSQELAAAAGYHEQVLNVHAWAKGVYFVNLSGDDAPAQSLKLVVE